MRSVLTHAILALGGLILAYVVWTDVDDPEEETQDAVVVWDCKATRVEAIKLVTDRREVAAERRKEGGEAYWWITSERRKANDEIASDKFVGSEAVDQYAEKVAPFKAARSLGALEKELLQELDLHEPDTTLELTCGGKTRRFAVGGRAYGSGDRYVRELIKDKQKGPVYLIQATLISDLESAEARLMQRDLHRFEQRDVETLLVDAFGEKRTLLQRDRLDPRQAKWVDSAEPDRRNELYGNWLDRVQRLRAREYLGPGVEPASEIEGVSAQVLPVATLVYKDADGAELGRLEMAKAEADPVEYYARTEATRSWVKLTRSVAEQVEQDARPVVGLEPIARTPEPSASEEADGPDTSPEAQTGEEAAPEASGSPGATVPANPHRAPHPPAAAPTGASGDGE